MDAIQKEIEATAVAEKKAAEEAAAAEAEGGGDDAGADIDIGGNAEEPAGDEGGDDDMDLAPMPMEAFDTYDRGETLLEGDEFLYLSESDDLPTPEQLDDNKDFSENK